MLRHRRPKDTNGLFRLALLLSATAHPPSLFAQVPLTMAKSFNPSTVQVGGTATTTMTVTITNPNSFTLGGISFSDTYPAGLVPDQVGAYTCNAGVATFNGSGWSLGNVTLGAGASCSVPILMHATILGQVTNTTTQVTGTGVPPGGPASATLNVALLGRGICTLQDAPAATLLIPYFEVGGSDANSPNTIISLGNSAATAVLAHVTLWSDLSVHVLDFNLYLTGYDVQNVNLGGLILIGASPQTASVGQDPADAISPKGPFSQDIALASCNGVLPLPPLPADYQAHVKAALTGQPDPFLGGKCAGQDLGDGIMRGYVTIDTVNQCTISAPGDAGYFGANGTGIATNQNQLFGNVTYVNKQQGKAYAEPAVAIEANAMDPRTSTPGNYTFYGRYDGWTAADDREPLATNFAARYVEPSGQRAVYGPQYFTLGTSLVVWRDSKVFTNSTTTTGGFTCPAQAGARPSWYPLGQEEVVIFDDQEHLVVPMVVPFSPQPPRATIVPFPAEAQKVKVGSDALPVPYGQGWMYLNLNTQVAAAGNNPPADPHAAQAWVSTVQDNSSPSWRVGYRATQLDSACQANHLQIGP